MLSIVFRTLRERKITKFPVLGQERVRDEKNLHSKIGKKIIMLYHEAWQGNIRQGRGKLLLEVSELRLGEEKRSWKKKIFKRDFVMVLGAPGEIRMLVSARLNAKEKKKNKGEEEKVYSRGQKDMGRERSYRGFGNFQWLLGRGPLPAGGADTTVCEMHASLHIVGGKGGKIKRQCSTKEKRGVSDGGHRDGGVDG